MLKKIPTKTSSKYAQDFEKLDLNKLYGGLDSSVDGLSTKEAEKRLAEVGRNEIVEKKSNWFFKFLSYFWGPIPWMIETAAILSIVIGHWLDFAVITLLLLANSVIGFWEEGQADNVIAALKKKLALRTFVKRDGEWKEIAANELIPGDVIRVRLGSVVPADAKMINVNEMEVDQSALTGESLPVYLQAGDIIYSSSIVRRGEAEAIVYATGSNTYFGKTAQLAQSKRQTSHFQKAILKVSNYLIMMAILMIALIMLSSYLRGDAILTTVEFSLVLLVAAIPVALPTVLSVTMAIGAKRLAAKKAVVSRLVAIEEMAGIDVLCSDKTGTLTQNKLQIGEPFCIDVQKKDDLVLYGALASRVDDGGEIAQTVINAAKDNPNFKKYQVLHYDPFNDATKRTEAKVKDPDGSEFSISMGAPQEILLLTSASGDVSSAIDKAIDDFASRGFRSLAVASTVNDKWQLVGIIPLFDPPREQAKSTIARAHKMGLKVKMLTGDHKSIAIEIAERLGMGKKVLDADALAESMKSGSIEDIEQADGFAGVFPQQKFQILDALQNNGHIVGMTGDGVNDAPALKKADCGIAVSGATDAARAAASIVLMEPGLSVIIDAIKESRKIFQRMQNYAIYRITETLRVLIFMTLSIIVFNLFPITAIMIVILALMNDGAILSIAYDNVLFGKLPEKWDMKKILTVSTVLGLAGVVSAFLLLFIAERVFYLPQSQIQTLLYLKLSVAGHLTIFLTRTRGRFWSTRPANILLFAVFGTQAIATIIAVYGIFMTPLGWGWAAFVWVYSLAWFLFNDQIKLITYKIIER